MAMNDWLARAYGTNGTARETDLEKTAQALMLNKLAEQEGIDLSGLNEEQLTMLAQEVAQQIAVQQSGGGDAMGAMGGMPGAPQPGMPAMGGGAPMAPPQAQAAQQPAPLPGPAAGAGPGPQNPAEGQFSEEQIKVAQAKMAEADFLGRMMAHALHQESQLIKQAQTQSAGPSAEEVEAEKTAMAYLQQRGYAITKQASEGPLQRAIKALGGSVR